MNPPTPPSDSNRGHDPVSHDAIVLASAALDGLLTPAEQEIADSDPHILLVGERFAQVRHHLRSPAPVDDVIREQHLEAALAVFDLGSSDGSVVSLDAARERRVKRWGTALTAAAAVAILGAVVATLVTRGSACDVAPTAGASVEITAAPAGDVERPVEPTAEAVAAKQSERAPVEPAGVAPAGTVAVGPAAAPADAATTTAATDLLIISDPSQLRSLAISYLSDVRSGRRPRVVNPCTAIEGVALASIYIAQHEALLVIAPNLEQASSFLVVAVPSCQVDSATAL